MQNLSLFRRCQLLIPLKALWKRLVANSLSLLVLASHVAGMQEPFPPQMTRALQKSFQNMTDSALFFEAGEIPVNEGITKISGALYP